MRKSALCVAILTMVFVSGNVFGAAPTPGNAGTGDSVKSWGTRSWDALKDINKLTIVYICDTKPKLNHFAAKVEGKDMLLNSDLADRFKKCICVMIKLQDPKDWPAQYTSMATNGAVIIIMSADKKHVETINKDSDSSKLTSDYLVHLLDAMIAADEKFQKEEKENKKVADAKEKKQDEQVKADNGGLGIKGLPGADDANKKDPKADDKKAQAAKKPDGSKKIVDE